MATDAAASATNEIVVTLASNWAWFDVHERVRATCGPLERGPTESTMPIRWLADAGKRILPGVEGELALTVMPSACTNIAFTGRFVPPAGLIGSAGGIVLGRQVAEAAVEQLLDKLVFHVEQSEPSPIPPNFRGLLAPDP